MDKLGGDSMISRRMMMNDKILTKSGEQLVLEKCKGSYFNGFSIYGKSTQVQTTGAQLYNPALWDALIERPDVKIVNHMDGSFEVSGSELTSILSYSHVYTHEETLDMFSVGDNVYLDANDTKTGIWFNIMFIKNGVNYSPKNGLTQEDLSDPTLRVKQVIFGNTGTKIIPGLVRPMLSKIKDADWEPYTGGKPSPSLEYQQDIVNAGDAGEINVSICGKNLVYIPDIGVGSGEKNLNSYIPSNFTVSAQRAPTKITKNVWRIRFEYKNGKFEYAVDGNLPVTIKVVPDNPIVKITTRDINIESGKYSGIQLELGSVATPYEPYKPAQTLTLATPNGLAGIPVKSGGNYVDENGQQWITDEIDCDREVKIQRIEKCKVNHEVVTYNPSTGYASVSGIKKADVNHLNAAMCTHLITKTGAHFWIDSTGKNFRFKVDVFSTEEEYKEFFRNNNVEVAYVLAEMAETPLTPEEITAYKALHTYAPNTIITNDSNCGTKLSYRKIR